MKKALLYFLRPVSTSANSAARPSDGLSAHAQLEIQAESERFGSVHKLRDGGGGMSDLRGGT